MTSTWQTVRQKMGDEWAKLGRFLLIGGTSFAINAVTYAGITRLLWKGGNHTLANAISVTIASIFNFFAHRSYTFRSNGRKRDQLPRYLFVMVTAMGLQTFLFWLGHAIFKVHDFLVIFVVGACIPLYTYGLHRWFTFRSSPEVVVS